MRKLAFLIVIIVVAFVCFRMLGGGVCVEEAKERAFSKLMLNFTKKSEIERVAIFKLDGDNAEQETTRKLIRAVIESGYYDVIERDPERLDKVLEEQKISAYDIIDPESAAKTGKILGVDAVVYGDVKAGRSWAGTARARVNARMVEAESGKIVWAGAGKAVVSRPFLPPWRRKWERMQARGGELSAGQRALRTCLAIVAVLVVYVAICVFLFQPIIRNIEPEAARGFVKLILFLVIVMVAYVYGAAANIFYNLEGGFLGTFFVIGLMINGCIAHRIVRRWE